MADKLDGESSSSPRKVFGILHACSFLTYDIRKAQINRDKKSCISKSAPMTTGPERPRVSRFRINCHKISCNRIYPLLLLFPEVFRKVCLTQCNNQRRIKIGFRTTYQNGNGYNIKSLYLI